jgi:hypothetical protein
MSVKDRQASDERLELIRSLHSRLSDWTQYQLEHVELARTFVELCKVEGLLVNLSVALRATAFAYSVQGNEHMTVTYAQQAIEALILHSGPKHQLIPDLEILALTPAKHVTWLYQH